jgi:hypothetical protein
VQTRGVAQGSRARARRGRPEPLSRTREPAAPPPGDGLVVGPVPVLARAAGVLLVLAGLGGAAALLPT